MTIAPSARKATLAIAAAVVTVLPVTTAEAATRTPSTIVVSGLPATIGYGEFQQTVRGTLETRVPAGQTPQPIPGATVQVYESMGNTSTEVSLGTATTGADGEFSSPVTLPAPGDVGVRYAGDATYVPTQGGAHVGAAATLPSKITLTGPASATPGATIGVTGQVTMQTPDGTWVPAPYASVSPSRGEFLPGRMDADADGRFSFSALAAHASPLTVHVNPNGTFPQLSTSAPLVTPYSSYPVRIIDFEAAQQPLNPGHFSFYADVSYDPDDANTAAYDGPITLEYLPKGSSTWITMASGTTAGSYSTNWDNYGEIEFKDLSGFLPGGKGVLAAGGSWRVRTPARPPYLASANSDQMTTTATVDAPTYVTGSKVTTRSGKRYFTGYLRDDHTVGAVPKVKIKIYYRKTKTGNPKYLGSVTTTTSGEFSYPLAGHAHGYYYTVFAGAAMPGGADAVGYFLNSAGPQVHYS